MDCCKKNCFVLLRGYSSRWDSVDWLSITFSTETKLDFTGFAAKFKLGSYVFENNDLYSDWIINLTAEQTATLPLGPNTASLIVYDTEGLGKPFTTSIPILVKDWVEGDVEVETYKATINATLDNQNEFIVKFETAKVSLDWVDAKIAEHNASESAHPYIRNLITAETERATTKEGAIERVLISEINERMAQDNALSRKIDNEADMRDAADLELNRRINAEESARIISDNDLDDRIDTEATLRDEADTQLQREIDSEINRSKNAERALQESKQDKLIAGDNITIVNNVISSSGGISNLDGGSASTVYMNTQIIDGGYAEGV